MLGLTILRIGTSFLMLYGHGWGKLIGFPQRMEAFPDPLGLGSSTSLGLAVFAEVFCSILVLLGIATRLAVVPLLVTMGVAFFIVHSGDPWAKREMALLYAIPLLTLLLCGGGKYQLGHSLGGLAARYT